MRKSSILLIFLMVVGELFSYAEITWEIRDTTKNDIFFKWDYEKQEGEFKKTVRLEFPCEEETEETDLPSYTGCITFGIPKGTKVYIED